MGRFFLFREVRPRGPGVLKRLKDNQTMTSFPLHRSPPKQIVRLIANKDNQVESLPENKATINWYMQALVNTSYLSKTICYSIKAI
jgi:hypothetical protein